VTTARFERVHIIGGGGSGKTTLARRLSARTRLPVIELDTRAEFDPASPAWISEGIFLWEIGHVLDRADMIVWMDLPRRVAFRRMVTRHIKLTVLRRNPHPGFRKMSRFVWGQREYYSAPARQPTGPMDWDALTRALTVEVLGPHRAKVVHLRSPRAVRTWLRTVR
jgi:uridine kinase